MLRTSSSCFRSVLVIFWFMVLVVGKPEAPSPFASPARQPRANGFTTMKCGSDSWCSLVLTQTATTASSCHLPTSGEIAGLRNAAREPPCASGPRCGLSITSSGNPRTNDSNNYAMMSAGGALFTIRHDDVPSRLERLAIHHLHFCGGSGSSSPTSTPWAPCPQR